MAQKVKHNKMIGLIQSYKKTSADKKAAAKKTESKRQEQLGNFSNPKISNLFKKKEGKQDQAVDSARKILKQAEKDLATKDKKIQSLYKIHFLIFHQIKLLQSCFLNLNFQILIIPCFYFFKLLLIIVIITLSSA